MKNIYFITYRTSEIRDSKRKLSNNFFSDVTIFNNMSLNGIGFKDNKEFKTKENIVYFEPLKDDFDYSKNIDYIKVWQDLFARLKNEYKINIIIINDTLTFGPWQGYEILCSCCLHEVKYSYITTDNLVELIFDYRTNQSGKMSLSFDNIKSFFESEKFIKLEL